MTIAARPTTYAGVEMRSRTEAQFAAFLDSIGWQWTYEPRAYAGPGRQQYLPDFLVGTRLAIEIKGTVKDELEIVRILNRMETIRDSIPNVFTAVIVADPPWGSHHVIGFVWTGEALRQLAVVRCECGETMFASLDLVGRRTRSLISPNSHEGGSDHQIVEWRTGVFGDRGDWELSTAEKRALRSAFPDRW